MRLAERGADGVVTLIVGLDLGERRIGIAVAEDDGRARGRWRRSRAVDAAADGCGRRSGESLPAAPDEVVVGLPFDMSGSRRRPGGS